jgi:hypothetical protein
MRCPSGACGSGRAHADEKALDRLARIRSEAMLKTTDAR